METEHLALYENISQCLTLSGVAKNKGRKPKQEDLGIIKDAAMVVDTRTNKILWVGESSQLPQHYTEINNYSSGEGEVWLPEFVECHSHLIFGGTRHHDYAERCRGKSYQDIAAAGGGILTTMKATRESSKDELIELAEEELDRFQANGVGIIEIKTGYGLTLESELKVLECVKELQEESSMILVPTFLAAHAIPPEFKGKADQYVDVICKEWIPEVAKQKLAKFFDVFIEEGYFSLAQARKLCESAKEFGLGIKLHVDQFSDLGGTDLGVELGAKSVDHLDHISEENIQKLAQSETVGVLLPGASLFTGTPYPPARKLLDAGARVALSTDYNPEPVQAETYRL